MKLTALKGRDLYSEVSRRGEVYHGKNFTLRFLRASSQQLGLAVVISKKVSAKASERNLLRRRIREYVRRHQAGIGPGNIILHVKQAASHLSRKDLYSALERALMLLRKHPAHERAL